MDITEINYPDNSYEDFSVTTTVEREEVSGQSDHVRIYVMDYLDRLKESGFQVTQFKWWNNKYGLLQDESVFLVTKSE